MSREIHVTESGTIVADSETAELVGQRMLRALSIRVRKWQYKTTPQIMADLNQVIEKLGTVSEPVQIVLPDSWLKTILGTPSLPRVGPSKRVNRHERRKMLAKLK